MLYFVSACNYFLLIEYVKPAFTLTFEFWTQKIILYCMGETSGMDVTNKIKDDYSINGDKESKEFKILIYSQLYKICLSIFNWERNVTFYYQYIYCIVILLFFKDVFILIERNIFIYLHCSIIIL